MKLAFWYDRFFTLGENEEKIKVLHKHPITLVKVILDIFLWVIIPLAIIAAFFHFGTWIIALFCVYLVVGVTYGVMEWLNWYNDVYVLTNERIIDVEQKSIFHKTVSEAGWDKVQDITFEIKGIFPTVFEYGNVIVRTASTGDNIILGAVSRPQMVQQELLRIEKEYENAHKSEMTASELLEKIKEAKG